MRNGVKLSLFQSFISLFCVYIYFFHLLTFFVATFGELLSKYGGEWCGAHMVPCLSWLRNGSQGV